MSQPLSRTLAIVTILKGSLGTGILGLPFVSGEVRLGIAAPLIFAFAAVIILGIWRLLECKTLLSKQVLVKDSNAPESGDGTQQLAALDNMGLGPLAIIASHTFGNVGIIACGLLICLCQLSFAISYTVVILETLSEDHLLGSRLPSWILHLIVCGILCSLGLMRKLKSLAWLSGAALTIYLYMLFALVYFGGLNLLDGRMLELSRDQWLPVRWGNFGLFFGTCLFAQCALVLSMYVYDDMQLEDPKEFIPVLVCSFGLGSVLYCFVGVFGYLAFGDEIRTVFYLSFPEGHPAVIIGEIALIVVLLFTYALQMYPVMAVLEAAASHVQRSSGKGVGDDERRAAQGRLPRSSIIAVRLAAVLLTQVIAFAVPDFACITGYSGCFAMGLISFILPPVCHAKVNNYQLSPLQWVNNAILFGAGSVALFFGFTATTC